MTKPEPKLKRLDVKNSAEFERFFNMSVTAILSQFKNHDQTMPTQELFLVKDGKITPLAIDVAPDLRSYTISGIRYNCPPGVRIPPEAVSQMIIERSGCEAYIRIFQSWIRKKSTTEQAEKDAKQGHGNISRLPPTERIEMLSIIGRTIDGKQILSKYFEIKREVHGDDGSKLLDMVELEGLKPGKDGPEDERLK